MSNTATTAPATANMVWTLCPIYSGDMDGSLCDPITGRVIADNVVTLCEHTKDEQGGKDGEIVSVFSHFEVTFEGLCSTLADYNTKQSESATKARAETEIGAFLLSLVQNS